MVGTLGKLYECIENLSDIYIQPPAKKNDILNPRTISYASTSDAPLLLPSDSAAESTTKQIYRCRAYNYSDCDNYWSDNPEAICPRCKNKLTTLVTNYVPPTGANAPIETGEGGYVKGVITYMIMDDLEVKPMSAISSISLLSKFNIKDLGTVEEKDIYLSLDEGLKLLKASLQSKTVLTDVFLGNAELKVEQSFSLL